MLICETGQMVGSLSAGCLEEEVAQKARDVLQTGAPTLMTFDTRKRFGCAGTINIFIECAADNFFADLAGNRDLAFLTEKSFQLIQRLDRRRDGVATGPPLARSWKEHLPRLLFLSLLLPQLA